MRTKGDGRQRAKGARWRRWMRAVKEGHKEGAWQWQRRQWVCATKEPTLGAAGEHKKRAYLKCCKQAHERGATKAIVGKECGECECNKGMPTPPQFHPKTRSPTSTLQPKKNAKGETWRHAFAFEDEIWNTFGYHNSHVATFTTTPPLCCMKSLCRCSLASKARTPLMTTNHNNTHKSYL